MVAVIFDFDGVVVDSEREKFEAIQKISRKYNVTITDDSYEHFIGKKRGYFLQNITDRETVENIMNEVRKTDKTLSFSLMKGFQELLLFLSEKNCLIALATGSQRNTVNQALIKHEIINFFDVIVSGDDVEASKPDPAVFLQVISQLSNDEDFYIVEDSPAGIEAAKKTKAKVICYGSNIAGADLYVNNHFDLLKYFKKVI